MFIATVCLIGRMPGRLPAGQTEGQSPGQTLLRMRRLDSRRRVDLLRMRRRAAVRKHPPKPISAPLVELDPANAFEAWLAHGQFKAVVEWAGNDEARLRRVAEARGYQPGWVWHRLKRVREADDDALLQAVWK